MHYLFFMPKKKKDSRGELFLFFTRTENDASVAA